MTLFSKSSKKVKNIIQPAYSAQYENTDFAFILESEKWDKPEKRRQKSRQRSPASPRQRRESGSSFKTETRSKKTISFLALPNPFYDHLL